MTSPQQRTRDPQPLGRSAEVAFVVLVGVAFVLGLAALAGLGLASLLAGGGWVWPASDRISAVLGGLLAGHPGRGLAPGTHTHVPSPAAVYGGIALAELAISALAAAAATLYARYHRPDDARCGMATRAEAAQVLGRRRLRQARPIIRPDL